MLAQNPESCRQEPIELLEVDESDCVSGIIARVIVLLL